MDRKWGTLLAVCVAAFMLLLDISIVNVALPSIQRSLHASFSDLQWVVDAYALTLATFMLTAGSLADLFGRKRLFLIGIGVFTVASAACGASFDPLFLIVSRAAQGIGGAMMFATGPALLTQEFHGRARGTAFGIWGATIGAAVAVGPLAGGMLTSWLSWRWIFFVNLPIGAIAVMLSLRWLHESSDPDHGRIDPIGLVTLVSGLFCLILGLIEGSRQGWTSTSILALFAAAVVLLVAFVISQATERTTMVDLTLFRRPAFVGAQISAFAISVSLFAMFLYFTLYMQNLLGLSPIATGVRFLPLSLIAFVVAPLVGRVIGRISIRILLGVGLSISALALFLLSYVSVNSTWTALLPGFILGGIGMGIVNPPLATAAVSTVQRERAGMASGINNTFRQVGIATGIAGLGAIFQSRVSTHLAASLKGVPHVHAIALQITSGETSRAIAAAPPQLHARIADAARTSFVAGFDDIMVVGAIIAACGAVCAFTLMRRQDFVASAPAPE